MWPTACGGGERGSGEDPLSRNYARRASQHVLEAEGQWPRGDPFKWELGRLVGVARDAEWFDPRFEEVVSAINDVRIAAVHPAAYIRDDAHFTTEPELGAVRHAIDDANDALRMIIRDLPDPPGEESG